MHGECFLAVSNISRTREAPTPTNISTKSEPEIEKNGTFGLAGNGPGQQGLAGAGRADHQHALGNVPTQALEFRRIAQKVDQLTDFVLGLFAPGHILESDLDLILALQLGARLAETHRAAAPTHATLHLAHEVDPQTDQHQNRQQG